MANKILFACSLFVAAGLFETGARTFGTVEYRSNQFQYIDGLGTWRAPNSSVATPIYSTYRHDGYSTNSLGMVDDEPPTIADSSVQTIAFLGDSMLEGLAVPPGKRFSDLLETLSTGSIATTNYGVSGVGTVQELAIYRTFVAHTNPDVVVLAFFAGNDIANNYLPLETLAAGPGGSVLDNWVYASVVDSSLLLQSPYPRVRGVEKGSEARGHEQPSKLKHLVRKAAPATYAHLAALRRNILARNARQRSADSHAASLAETGAEYVSVYSNPEEGSMWTEAWRITEAALIEIDKDVRANGSRLLVAILPDPIHAYPDPRKTLESTLRIKLPPNFDPTYPHKRIAGILQSNAIDYVSLVDTFTTYASINNLKPPYFGFPTDGHWNKLGHEIAAASILEAISTHPK